MPELTAIAQPASAVSAPRSGVWRALRFLRTHWLAFLLCSAALVIPCVWHHHIQAGDLGSHLYTAWLSQSVARGLLPGLHLDRQYTNVLFDLLLSNLFPFLGGVGTERVAVAFCVLLFFWGSFAFASAAADRAAWSVAPLLAMISYGAIFHLGFFNFYLSVAFSLYGLALIVRGTRHDFWLLLPILAISALAHPMGSACLVALGVYLAALRWFSPRMRMVVTFLLAASGFAVRYYLVHHFEVLQREVDIYWLLGADQFVVFGHSYRWIAVAALVLCVGCALLALRRSAAAISPWIQFYLVIALLVCFAPGGIYSEKTFGMMGYLPDRGSLYSVLALAALVASCRPRAWFVVTSALVAAVFFGSVYRDTGILDRREAKISSLVHGHRVISLVPPIAGSRIRQNHLLDRACIGRCYAYGNYEPSSMQFRLKAEPGNHVVEVDQNAFDAMQDGSYVVRSRDLPLYEVYQCGPATDDICISELHKGQQNGDVPGITARP